MELTGAGRLLYGRYRLQSVVGRGGMGVVWQARDELLNRDVAVKELIWPPHLSAADQLGATRRAVREAQLAGRLAHQNVVRIYDILQEEGQPWIVMELLAYPSLHDLVQEEGPLTPARAATVGLGVLAALRAAHAEGVLHRDVKPANILVGQDGRVVLTDFGIARAVDAPTQTTAGALAGSPSYLAPERASGGHSTPAGDLWGLGACLYQAVEGRPPFERADPLATLTAVITEEPAEAVHAGTLWPVISGLLRKNPDERLDAAQTEWMLGEVAGLDELAPDSAIAEDTAGDHPAPQPAPSEPTAVDVPPPEAANVPPPEAANVTVPEAADVTVPTSTDVGASTSRPTAAPVPAPAAVTSFDQLPAAVPPAAPASRPRRSSRLAGALIALVALAAAVAALVFAVTSWPGRSAALPGGISPSASRQATAPASSASGAPATSASGTASAPASGTASAPASGTASAPASAKPSPAPSGSPAGSPNAGSTADDTVPAGYYRFTNSTGFSIGVPHGWQISHVGHYVYITDPSNSGIFLLIDQSDTPKPNPLADWQQQAANRAGTYPDYRLLRLASVSYPQAEKAADWEFTYDRDGIPVQILIRNVLANAHHAYALYWSTPETNWNGYYHYFTAFAATFRPAP